LCDKGNFIVSSGGPMSRWTSSLVIPRWMWANCSSLRGGPLPRSELPAQPASKVAPAKMTVAIDFAAERRMISVASCSFDPAARRELQRLALA
jgi:hypothetical protein